MGYDILIGNAVPHSEWGDTTEPPTAQWVVERETCPQAPHTPDSGQTNLRSPSYMGWNAFLREVGLYELFLGEDGLMVRHPGTAKLTRQHAEEIEKAAEVWRQQNPDAVAVFCECKGCCPWTDNAAPHNPQASGTLVRLQWLTFWVRRAVDTYEHPAIQNW